MAGGLRLGSLFVSLQAETTSFSKGMASAMKDMERFSKEAKRVASEVAMVSGVMAGVGAAAVRLAANVDGPTKSAMNALEKSTQLLAVQVADMLLPAVRELTAMFKKAASVVAGLDPELKKQISAFAVMAVQVAVAAKAFSVFAGFASSVFTILKGGFAMVAAVGVGPLLNIVAAIGLVIGAALLLHRAWRKNWGGIQEATADVLAWLQDGFKQFAGFMGKVWDFLVDGAAKFVDAFLSVGDVLERVTGKNLGMKGLREGFTGLWKDLKSGSFFAEAFKFGKTLGAELVEGIAEEWASLTSKLKLPSGTAIQPRSAHPQRDISGHGFMADERARNRALMDAAEQRDSDAGVAAAAAHAEGISHSNAAGHSSNAESDRSGSAAAATGLSQADMIAGAVGAADWGEAQKILQNGLDGAADFGTTLSVWGQRMAGIFAKAGTQIFGAVGELVSSIAEGAKQGGVVGAFMAAIMEVVKSAASAMDFLGTALNFVKQLGAMIEPLVKPVFDVLTDVLGAIIKILAPIFSALKPLFELITNVIGYLFPILAALGSLFEAIGPILEVVFKVVGMILQILEPIFKLIGGVIKIVATALLGFIVGLNEIAAALGDKKAAAEAKRLRKVVDNMWREGADERFRADSKAAGAALRNSDAQNEAADAATKMTEALTNVPEGFKIAGARYRADMGIGGRAAPKRGAGPEESEVRGDEVDSSGTISTSGDGTPAVAVGSAEDVAFDTAFRAAMASGATYTEAITAAFAARDAAKRGGGGSQKGSGGSQKSSGPGFKSAGGSSVSSSSAALSSGATTIVIEGDVILSGADIASVESFGQALEREAKRQNGQRSGNPSRKARRG